MLLAIEKKRYWLKLEKDFLKSTQIKVIKNMPNGKDYILFYLALMLESVETVGHLRFAESIPYNEEMLAVVTDTNVDITRSAVKVFERLGLIQMLEDGTVFIPNVPKMTGKESESAERVRNFRDKQKEQPLQCNEKVLLCDNNVQNSNAYSEYNKQEDKQRTENREKEDIPTSAKPPRSLFSDDSNEMKLAKLLADKMRKNNPECKLPTDGFQGWCGHIEKMIRIDKRQPKSIQEMILFSQWHQFWKKNILSAKALREKYDRLELEKLEALEKREQCNC